MHLEATALFFSKFSDELLMAQTALLFFALSLATYWMLVRKKKRESAEWVPAALVRAYLDRVRADERDTRFKLFGEEYSAPLTAAPTMAAFSGGMQPQQVVMNVSDPALAKELEALRVQLTMADQRSMEFDRMVNGLKAEKTSLEQRLAQAQAAAAAVPAGATAGAADPALQKELQELRAKLQEYEVIEDDLANLKKFQKENEQLRQQIASGGGATGATLTVVPGGPAAAVPSTVISGVTEKIDTAAMTVVSGGASTANSSTVVSGGATPASAVKQGEANTNVLAPITPTVDTGAPAPVVAAAPAAAPAAAAPAAAAGPEKSAKQKEEELLSEFEKMLAS